MATKGKIYETLLAGLEFDGVTLSGGKVYFCTPGGTITDLKDIWLDRDKTTPAANPYTLDPDGRAEIFGDGVYDIVVKTAALVTKATWPNVSIHDDSEDGGGYILVSKYASLTAAVSSIGSNPGSLFLDVPTSLTANTTIPATLHVVGSIKGIISKGGYNLTINGPFEAGLYQVFSGSGTVLLPKAPEIWPEWWGAVGNNASIDSIAIRAALACLVGNTSGGGQGVVIHLTKPEYWIDGTLTPPNSASNWTMLGVGMRNTRLIYKGTSGIPFIKMNNARNVTFSDFSIFSDASHKPTYSIQVNRAAGLVGSAAPLGCIFRNLGIGGDGSNATTTGIGYTCDVGYDANNEQGLIDNCEIMNASYAGVSLEHSNSLWHRITKTGISSCGYAISNIKPADGSMGGGFEVAGLATSGCNSVYNLGASYYPISIYNSKSESDQKLLTTVGAVTQVSDYFLMVYMHDSSLTSSLTSVDAELVNISIDKYRIYLDNVMTTSELGGKYVFTETLKSEVWIASLRTQIKTIDYNCKLYIGILSNDSGITYNNLGSGVYTSLIPVSGDTAQTTAVSSGVTDPLLSYATLLIISSSAPTITDIPGGYPGKVITVLATSGSPTIITNGSNFSLKSGANASVPYFGSVTLVKTTAGYGAKWVEINRSF